MNWYCQYLPNDPKKSLPRPLQRPQTDQTCGAHNFHARYNILTEMYWSRQYLSIDPKKFGTPTLTRIKLKSVNRPHNHILRSRVGGAFQLRFAACISPFPFGIW